MAGSDLVMYEEEFKQIDEELSNSMSRQMSS